MPETGLSFVVYRECGCMCSATVIDDEIADYVKAVASQHIWAIKNGKRFARVPHQEVRDNPWGCDKCRPPKQADLFEEAAS